METDSNSPKIIFPEALNVWMGRQGWAYDGNELCYSKRGYSGKATQVLRALHVPLPASHPYFVELASNVGTPHAELVETLFEWSQDFLKSERPEAEVPEEPTPKPSLISPEAVREFLLDRGWKYNERTGVFNESLTNLGPMCRELEHPFPSDHSHFDWIARHTGISRDILIEDLLKRTEKINSYVRSRSKASVTIPEAASIAEAVRAGLSYARESLWMNGGGSRVHTLPSHRAWSTAMERAFGGGSSTRLILHDIREMERALELLGFKE
jgi:hypothetical protein